ncbi:hypothetical protein OK348_16935 [Flavobacterium sp. MXW15]|uniref:Transmembrane protein n=1 Tax=Xanthomonas chitinilytica TaxID=2989819 RepID=A0ABT3K090_9XANT|nr:hypothetical protein [Xanthomonas sp. H13-6]MCW4456467.1 hypothetical protein [Flavobacterium sp. MXW15]MCW4474153.1 hypothetical protein [Xanthomonas sp. H13-6]
MTAAPAPLSPAAASTLSAFLRGVERRALVVAELQAGDAGAAERAVAAAMRAFASHAAGLAMADWPGRFWGLLGNTPQLREPVQPGQRPMAMAHLSQLPAGERLALLLRIGAGLDEVLAATVLGGSVADYRQALADACPLDAAGHPDAAAWRVLAEQVQLQVRELAPDRLAQLARLREAALAGGATTTPAATRAVPAAGPVAPRRRGYWVAAALLLALLAAGVWWWRSGTGTPRLDEPLPARDGVVVDAGPVQVEELPGAAPPARAPAVDGHAASDAAMLADPELALARDADFYAWFAAGGPIPVDESQPQPTRPAPAAAGLETVDAED